MDEELAPELLIRLWSNGGNIWDKHFNVCLDTPENAKAFRTILDTLKYTPGSPFETDIQQTVSDFASGKTAMLVTYTEYASEISAYIHKTPLAAWGTEPYPGTLPPVSAGILA